MYRAAHDDVVGTGCDRLLRVGHTGLIAGGAAGQPDAGRHDRHARAENRAHARGFEAGCHHAVAAGIAGECGAACDEVLEGDGNALLADVGGVQVGQHGDAQDLEAGAGSAGHARRAASWHRARAR